MKPSPALLVAVLLSLLSLLSLLTLTAAASSSNHTTPSTPLPSENSDPAGPSMPAFDTPMSAAAARATLPSDAFGFDFSTTPKLPYCPGLGADVCYVQPIMPSTAPALALPDLDVQLTRAFVAGGNDGTTLPIHVHRVVEVQIVMQGVIEYIVWPEVGFSNVIRNTLKAGGVSTVPAGAPHGQRCIVTPCEAITVFKTGDPGFYPVTPSGGSLFTDS